MRVELRRRSVQIGLAAWVVPFLVAVSRALVDGWWPMGDRALIPLRAHDVLTRHHPLLGTSASVALGSGVVANHPGPLLFDLVALPVRLFGIGAGAAIAVASINVVVGLIVIHAAWRSFGERGAAAVLVMFVALATSMGSESLFDPYNPRAVMIPLLGVVVLAACVRTGDPRSLPWLAALASLCVQTNIAYAVLAGPVLVGVWVACFVRPAPESAPARRRASLIAVVVLAVLWAQPLIDLAVNRGDSNVARLIRASRSTEPPLGFADGTRRMASIASPWGRWIRRDLDDYPVLSTPPSIVMSLMVVLGGLAVATALLLASRRMARHRLAAMLQVAVATMALAWLATMRVPLSPFYGFAPDYVRWLWPLAVFWWIGLGVATLALFGTSLRVPTSRLTMIALCIAVALAVINLPIHSAADDLATAAGEQRIVDEFLDESMAALRPLSTVYYAPTSPGYASFDPALLAAMIAGGVDFTVSDEVLVRQFGESRRGPPDAFPALRVTVGVSALIVRDDPETVAFASIHDDAEVDDVADRIADVVAIASDGGLVLAPGFEDFASSPLAPPWVAELAAGGAGSWDVVGSQDFAQIAANEMLVVTPGSPLSTAQLIDLADVLRDADHTIVAAQIEGVAGSKG